MKADPVALHRAFVKHGIAVRLDHMERFHGSREKALNELAKQALAHMKAREGEDIEEWARVLVESSMHPDVLGGHT